MKTRLITCLIICFGLTTVFCYGQGPYYNGVDLNLEGTALRDELAGHVISTHTDFLTYSEVYQLLKITDLVPGSSTHVQLIYGSDDTDGLFLTDLTRDKEQTGGTVGSWNREHVYPRSLGTPEFNTSGPGSDAHALRSCDLQMNSTRGNRKFITGSGVSGSVGSAFYPGDQWKGDVARMMMYMYLRYGTQCLPINVGNGTTNTVDANMVDLFLDWNAEDPVSAYETSRNDILETEQGNRNPFIDSPALATIIWGGPNAEDPWGLLAPDIELSLKLFLEGPFSAGTNLMNDNLRATGILPISEPLSAQGHPVTPIDMTTGVYNTTGNDAIVDWILLEIRDGNSPTTVLEARAVVVQRDGDVVSPTGDPIMIDPNMADDVFIAVRHRNHFGIRTSTANAIDQNFAIDFTDPSTGVFGFSARKLAFGFALLFAGDASDDGAVNAVDLNQHWRMQNGLGLTYAQLTADFNLDGSVNAVDKSGYWRVNNGLWGTLD